MTAPLNFPQAKNWIYGLLGGVSSANELRMLKGEKVDTDFSVRLDPGTYQCYITWDGRGRLLVKGRRWQSPSFSRDLKWVEDGPDGTQRRASFTVTNEAYIFIAFIPEATGFTQAEINAARASFTAYPTTL